MMLRLPLCFVPTNLMESGDRLQPSRSDKLHQIRNWRLRAHNNLKRIQPSCISTFTFLFSLPSFSSSVIPLCISFLYTHPFFIPISLHCVSIPPSVCGFFGFESAGIRNNGTGELKVRQAHFSFGLCYSFPSASLSVFLIDWPGGLCDPESYEGAEQHKEPGL